MLNGQPISCAEGAASLSDLRFFVSAVAFIDAAGGRHEVALLRDDRWQSREVALLDLENGEGRCLNGSAEMNTMLRGTVDTGDYVALSFVVGVPFALNHANPLLAEPPLSDAAMHWHWRSGYKFMRAGLSTASDGFRVHLGSTGCTGTVRNIGGCTAPNRISVELTGTPEVTQDLVMELSSLLAGVDLQDGQSSACLSGPGEETCGPVFQTLGLDFSADSQVQQQSIFKVRD